MKTAKFFYYGTAIVFVIFSITTTGCKKDKKNQTTVVSTPQLIVVSTAAVTNIGGNTATCGGNITNDGGSTITSRGVCWSTNPDPTINDSTTSNGTGAGIFVSQLTNLLPNTLYYVRAYATNNAGTGYGSTMTFTTVSNTSLPVVYTSSIYNISNTSAVSGGNVSSDGGFSVLSRGVCWNTSPSPTINNNITSNGSGTGQYTSNVTGLLPNTLYYLRAYATNSNGTSYGDEVQFTTTNTSGNQFGTFQNFSNIILGSQYASTGSFWASVSNTVYSLSAAATNCSLIDIAYFYGATNQATLGAPSNTNVQTVFSSVASWSTKNNTLFLKNPVGFTFTSINETTDIANLTFGTETQANMLVVGDVVAFRTANNKIGFAFVTSIDASSSGNITFSVKVQQ